MNRPNPGQWEAIRNTHRHTLVSAGAGTGKTSTVVGRILYLLGAEVNGQRIERPITLREIGAVTYTNAAAADLKRKLRGELRESGLRDVAYEVDNARIGTIHGFAGDILREFSLRTGRDPGLHVLDEGAARMVTGEVVRETLLAALEQGSVSGLEELLSVWSVADLEGWVARLIGDGDRLLRIVDGQPDAGELERVVIALAQRTLVRLNARLAERSAMDFDRMIVWTRDLLRDEPAVRRALQRRIHTLIVDEFQDVDPVQREIAWLLGQPGTDGAATRLMLVGDPKQSIYRFRRADVTVWSSVEREFREQHAGDVVVLDENYRSTNQILGFVERTVGSLLDMPLDGSAHQDFEVPFSPVRAVRPEPEGPPVELIVVSPDADGKAPKAEEARSREAAAVARRAVEFHAQGAAWRNMALLFTSWTDVSIYESACRNAGIPTYALRQAGFYTRREVQDMVLALEATRDPQDDRALFGWLRSPFIGVRDETLLAIARSTRPPYWQAITAVDCAERELLAWAAELLAEHVAIRDRVPTSELMQSLLERSGYLAHLSLLGDDGLQAIANLRKLARMAGQSPEQSVGEFLRQLGEARTGDDREGDARLYGDRDDVVTLTSVHSSKGLEWPIVFWCDTARGPAGGGPGNIIIGRDRIALKDPDTESGDQPQHYLSLATVEADEANAERKRVWYVASTRAKDRLIVSGICPGARGEAKSAAGALTGELSGLTPADGVPFCYADRSGRSYEGIIRLAPAVAEEPAPIPAPGAERQLPESLPMLAARSGRTRHSATELMLLDRCERRHWFRYVAMLREPTHHAKPGSGAIARGQIVHDVLEHLGDDPVKLLLETAIGRWDPDAPTPDVSHGTAYRAALRRDIDAVAGDPAYAALAAAPGARRELPFLYLSDSGSSIEGAVDLIARADDGLVLLDVKTHTGPGDKAEIARRYDVQRDTYIEAAEAISGERVVRFAFQFPDTGQVAETVTDAMRASGQARISALLERLGQADTSLAKSSEDCRWCGYRDAGWCPGVEPA